MLMLFQSLLRRGWVLALTERERQILRLKAEGFSDYRIARKLRMETPNVYRARKAALRKIDRARADLSFADSLKL
jgi:transcriptional regulator